MKEFIEGFIDGALPATICILLIMSGLFDVLLFINIGYWIMGEMGILVGLIVGIILWCGLYDGAKRWLQSIPRNTNSRVLRELKEWIR